MVCCNIWQSLNIKHMCHISKNVRLLITDSNTMQYGRYITSVIWIRHFSIEAEWILFLCDIGKDHFVALGESQQGPAYCVVSWTRCWPSVSRITALRPVLTKFSFVIHRQTTMQGIRGVLERACNRACRVAGTVSEHISVPEWSRKCVPTCLVCLQRARMQSYWRN